MIALRLYRASSWTGLHELYSSIPATTEHGQNEATKNKRIGIYSIHKTGTNTTKGRRICRKTGTFAARIWWEAEELEVTSCDPQSIWLAMFKIYSAGSWALSARPDFRRLRNVNLKRRREVKPYLRTLYCPCFGAFRSFKSYCFQVELKAWTANVVILVITGDLAAKRGINDLPAFSKFVLLVQLQTATRESFAQACRCGLVSGWEMWPNRLMVQTSRSVSVPATESWRAGPPKGKDTSTKTWQSCPCSWLFIPKISVCEQKWDIKHVWNLGIFQ